MAGLPKGLLKSLIKEGYDPPEAMKEAWRIVGVQKKRYAARMSHGGEYPLGYKGRKNPSRKISFSKWLTSVEREFGLAGVHPKWSGFTARKLYKVYSPKKAAELVILASKRSNHKNPVISGTFAGLVDNPPRKRGTYLDLSKASQSDLDYALNVASILRSSGFEKRANQIEKMVKNRKGYIAVDDSTSLDTPAYIKINPRRQKTKKNPIAVFNPGGGTLIYGRVIEIKAVKTSGQYKGEHYSHKFGPHVQAFGLSSGEVLLKSNNGSRLWKSI